MSANSHNSRSNQNENEVIDLLDSSDDEKQYNPNAICNKKDDGSGDDVIEVIEIDNDQRRLATSNNIYHRQRSQQEKQQPQIIRNQRGASSSSSSLPFKKRAATTEPETIHSNRKDPPIAARGASTQSSPSKDGTRIAGASRRKSASGNTRASSSSFSFLKDAAKRNDSKKRKLQKSLVLEEDDDDVATMDEETKEIVERFQSNNSSQHLFQDETFGPLPSSIHGQAKSDKGVVTPKCRCSGGKLAKLAYSTSEKNNKVNYGRPYYTCGNTGNGSKRCNYFSWAYAAEHMQWFRFGQHTNHKIVQSPLGFSAQDLCQGRVGDCWFLSALAVVAERPDLIQRLFPRTQILEHQGLIQVKLFIDGFWKTVIIDNFLPCQIDTRQEQQLQQTMQASMKSGSGVVGNRRRMTNPYSRDTTLSLSSSSSKTDPYAIADDCKHTLQQTYEFIEQHQFKTLGKIFPNVTANWKPASRQITTSDLAYSKALNQQLWVPLLEKAYAKSHGCYKAISGGHIAEAFLDLTGAPTKVYRLMNAPNFQPRDFWYQLLKYKRQQLPMGCGTDNSAAGIIGMHAYSILDVREITGIPFQFFHQTGVAHGNVSGFLEKGTVRLLKIRNPHGKGEWQGDFSDRSQIWQLLQSYLDPTNPVHAALLQDRTMKNDGTFWIDYDNFLMGFSNVDVVLAFVGNHAKSFQTNFPMKKSNHRCVRAYEISMLAKHALMPMAIDDSDNNNDNGVSNDKVEVYIMGIQKTRRGATSGRTDRKKSYKVCDLGMLVGSRIGNNEDDDDQEDDSRVVEVEDVQGQMFGFRRDGHYRLVLERSTKPNAIVMPISFGHPAATDKELSFAIRFVSDVPVMILELPQTPRLDVAILKYCLGSQVPSSFTSGQGVQKVILEEANIFRILQINCLANGGGVVFLHLFVNEGELLRRRQHSGSSASIAATTVGLSFEVEARCRGMSCRVENGLLEHETLAKGKKFEASWRKFTTEFSDECQSRLLLVLYQSGQDTEFGSITCKKVSKLGGHSNVDRDGSGNNYQQQTSISSFLGTASSSNNSTNRRQSHARIAGGGDPYVDRGIFNPIPGNDAYIEACRSKKASASAYTMFDGDIIIHDDSMERAMELSRSDLELQQALEISQQNGGDNDFELQQALELSKQQSHNFNNRHSREMLDDGDDNLRRALELSKMQGFSSAANVAKSRLEDEKGHVNDADLQTAIRLSMSQQQKPSANRRSRKSNLAKPPSTSTSVLDFTNSGGEDVEKRPTNTAKKRVRPESMENDEKCENANAAATNPKTDDSTKPKDLAEKRRLALEAAMKRQAM